MRNLKRTLTDACYEVVDDTEFRRYYEALVQVSGFGVVDWAFNQAGFTAPGAVQFYALDPMAQRVMIDELDLSGLIKPTITIGRPDDITGFRPTSIDFELIDARRKNGVWHARLPGNIMESMDANQTLSYMTEQLAGAIGRKANACGEPQKAIEPAFEVKQGVIDLPDRIYFELGSATLSTRSYPLLDDLALWFSENPQVKLVRIEGHTDDIGDDATNLRLSEQRARAVHAYLASKGVDALRIEPIGFGETRPVVANDNALNRSTNRRVEFRVVQ